MFSLPTLDVNCNLEDDWVGPAPGRKLYGVASVGNSWGVISIGRGFNWSKQNDLVDNDNSRRSTIDNVGPDMSPTHTSNQGSPIPAFTSPTPLSKLPSPKQLPSRSHTMFVETASLSPSQSPSISPHSTSFLNRVNSFPIPSARSPSAPRPRRRSSKQRVSLVAGQVSIRPADSPPIALLPVPGLLRADSSSSFLSSAASTAPPSPQSERESFLGRRSISEFDIERVIGKGAYGTVKRAREKKADGSLGVRSLLSPAFPALLRCGSRRSSSRK
jgi:protein-serine/threonine kinase